MERIIPEMDRSRSETIALRLRYRAATLTRRALEASGGELGPGAHIRLGPDARVHIGPGFYGRRDLTLICAGRLEIGASVACNRGTAIVCLHEMTIGEGVRMGERVSLLDHDHAAEPLADLPARLTAFDVAPVRIGPRVLIGANAVVLAGASIGADAVIGAGSVVTGEIPPRTLAVGVPARVRRELR